MDKPQILIIRHGALGDLILSLGPMQAIRRQHPDAQITLLTARPFDALMRDCPFIDEIRVDTRPKPWHIRRFAALIHQLRARRWDWVYDLQTSRRSTGYFRLLKTRCYSGLHPKGSHPHDTPERTRLHTIERQKQQLAIAGIHDVPPANLDWLEEDHPPIRSSDPIILLVPGGSAHRPEKRWPAAYYGELAARLAEDGYQPVLLGTKAEEETLQIIRASDHRIINLCNQTSFARIASLARCAAYAIGNDTGPMHLIAAAGCPCTVLFNTTASNPDLCAPRGAHVTILKSDDLKKLTVDFVANTVITTP